jgi:hypothetical protein
MAIDSADDVSASGGPAFGGWLFFLGVGFFAGMLFSGRGVGQAALQPDPDAFPAEVVPRSAATMARDRARLLKRSGKPKLTSTDGL